MKSNPSAGSKRPRKVVGFGEYEYEQESSVATGRQSFLYAVRDCSPKVLDALEGIPYQKYLQFSRQSTELPLYQLIHESATTAEAWLRDLDESLLSAYRAVRECLEKWSRRWNLDAEWCRDWALKTLYEWEQEDAAAKARASYIRVVDALGTAVLGTQIERPRHWASTSGQIARPFLVEELGDSFVGNTGGDPPLVRGMFAFAARENDLPFNSRLHSGIPPMVRPTM